MIVITVGALSVTLHRFAHPPWARFFDERCIEQPPGLEQILTGKTAAVVTTPGS